MMQDAMLEEVTRETMPAKIVLAWFAAFGVGMLSGLAGGYAGWLYDDGWFPIVAGASAFCIGFALIWCLCGPFEYYFHKVQLFIAPPELSRLQTIGFRSFDLYVTIHSVQNLHHAEDPIGLFGSSGNRQLYVQLEVGRLLSDDAHDGMFSKQKNPLKRTCTSHKLAWEECFLFNIAPTDDTLRLTLFDQDVFIDDHIAFADIDITDQVLLEGFPQKRVYELYHGSYDKVSYRDVTQLAGNIVVSFSPGENFSQTIGMGLEDQNKFAFQHLRSERGKLASLANTDYQVYGSTVTQMTA